LEALTARGNLAEALLVYERLRVLLRDELGVAPPPSCRRCTSGWSPARGPSPCPPVDAQPADRHPLPTPLLVSSPLPFVGRSGELETLRALMQWDEQGAARAVLIGGAAGSGKGRLVREFARQAAGGAARWSFTACATPWCIRRTGRSWRRSITSYG
jgi:hypothetical protein